VPHDLTAPERRARRLRRDGAAAGRPAAGPKHVAESLLENARQVTDVRNMLGFTGSWRGRPVSVMGGGIGIPSTLIYATELARDHGVKRIVRIGTCGGIQPSLDLGDIVVALGAGTDSNVNRIRFGGYDLPATASFGLVEPVLRAAAVAGQRLHVGNVFSSDLFYHPDDTCMRGCARWDSSPSRWKRRACTASRPNSASRP
jgi:DeoD family purine-nucleoside phosphorylase